MSINIRTGLPLGFNEEALAPVVQPLIDRGLLDDILLHVRMWVMLSGELALLGAMTAALSTRDWRWTVAAAVGGNIPRDSQNAQPARFSVHGAIQQADRVQCRPDAPSPGRLNHHT